ncbi:FAD-binding oxidoreductase [candidate division KSB1 bacterium]|nr:FAD-binding oxidoreductase [candidate division KSB1 bacterium]
MIEKVLITVGAMAGLSGVLALLLVIAESFLANYGECKININQGEKELALRGGASLLSSLNSQKIFLPSACGGRGTCAYCKCKVLDGAGVLLPTEAPLLSPTEIQNQVRLACQVKVKRDLKIEIPAELFNIQEFTSEVTVLQNLTHDIKLLRLTLREPTTINFKAGQYVQLVSPPYDGVKTSVQRAYSIASSSFEKNYIDLMIRLVPDGICTTWVHEYLHLGDRVKFAGPMGDFQLHAGTGEIVIVAGGSGMAPIVSLLEEIARKKIDRKVTYFFGAGARRDLFYLEEMAQLQQQIPNFTFVPTLSSPAPTDDWTGLRGLITMPLEAHLAAQNNANVQSYMCGSPGMINACIKILKKYGITDDRIFFDPFA